MGLLGPSGAQWGLNGVEEDGTSCGQCVCVIIGFSLSDKHISNARECVRVVATAAAAAHAALPMLRIPVMAQSKVNPVHHLISTS